VQLRTLAPTALAVATTAVLGGLASRPAQSVWYQRLKKPPYQPPRQAFPIVWPILYADIAAVSSSTLDELETRGRSDERRAYIVALAANLVLNGSWSWLFFSRGWLGTSAIAAGLLTVSSADLTRRAMAVQGPKAAPLAAYPAWCAFATALSTHIWALNRR
jgi:tryptophan-rich sensory protein